MPVTIFLISQTMSIITFKGDDQVSKITITKRGNVYQYRFQLASRDGQRKWFSKSGFRTKKEAENAGAKALAQYNETGLTFRPSEISVSDYFDWWIENYCLTHCKPVTIKSYQKKINLFIKPELGMYKLKALSRPVIQKFMDDKFDMGYSRNTLIVLKSILSGALKEAVKNDFIKYSPMQYVDIQSTRVKPKIPTRKKVKQIVTLDQWKQIIERFPEGHPAHMPLMLAYHCGFRLGEIFGLMWEDVDFKSKTITVNRQVQMDDDAKKWTFTNPKYDSFRTIDIGNELYKLLKREHARQERSKLYYAEYYTQLCVSGYVDDQTGHPFNNGSLGTEGEKINMIMVRENGTYIQPRIMQHVGRVIHGKAGKNCVCISESWDLHSLRHTHATMLFEDGVPLPVIQERLGHAKIDTTEHYADHVTDTMHDDLLKAINAL